jgi:hypothetical protein
MQDAVKWAQIHEEVVEDLERASPVQIPGWRQKLEAWLKDKASPDPFFEQESGEFSLC